jgi:glutathione S-transferase
MVLFCAVTAEAAGKPVTVVTLTEEQRASAEYKNKNMTGKFPLLETPEGCLNESVAIAKFLAHGHPTLLGADEWQRAKVDQWCQW